VKGDVIRGTRIPLPKHDTVVAWSRSQAAKDAARWLREGPIEQRLAALLIACESTTDIRVAKAYSELKILASFATTFELEKNDEKAEEP